VAGAMQSIKYILPNQLKKSLILSGPESAIQRNIPWQTIEMSAAGLVSA
jgi:hypothetical protein